MCKYWFVRATHITAKSTNLDISVHLNRYVLNVTCCLVTIIVICLLFKLFTLLDRNQIWKLLVSGEALKKAMCRNREVCGRKGQRSISDRTISETTSAVRRREAQMETTMSESYHVYRVRPSVTYVLLNQQSRYACVSLVFSIYFKWQYLTHLFSLTKGLRSKCETLLSISAVHCTQNYLYISIYITP